MIFAMTNESLEKAFDDFVERQKNSQPNPFLADRIGAAIHEKRADKAPPFAWVYLNVAFALGVFGALLLAFQLSDTYIKSSESSAVVYSPEVYIQQIKEFQAEI